MVRIRKAVIAGSAAEALVATWPVAGTVEEFRTMTGGGMLLVYSLCTCKESTG